MSELPDWTPAYQRIVESCANCPSLRVLANDAAQAVAARYGLPQGVTPNSEQKGQEFFYALLDFEPPKIILRLYAHERTNVRSLAYIFALVRVHLFSREKNATKYAVPHRRSSFLIVFQALWLVDRYGAGPNRYCVSKISAYNEVCMIGCVTM